MTDAFDLVGGVAAALRDRSAAWAFLDRFAREWAPVLPADRGPGWDAPVMDAASARLGVPLPAALREGYALLGAREDLTGELAALLVPPNLLRVHDGVGAGDDAGVLVFHPEENSALGVRVADLGQDDPPVVEGGEQDGWRPYLDRLSAAFLDIVLWQWLTDWPDAHHDVLLAPDDPGLDALTAHCTPLALAHPGGRYHLAAADTLLCTAGPRVVLAAARTAAGLAAARALLPGTWQQAPPTG
ncbi:hypothetical protein [Streptomyces avicenniae]|uniref:hypothetical protein n=1 Tax=Streptomyces avicenniae TaxID=500153 RepID=UPI000699FB59|nr:hypothetical protein [Streptomyces avicenniae]